MQGTPEQIIEATITGIEPQGNGWVQINTDQGPFATKFPEPIAEAQAHLFQRVAIAYQMGESRPKRDGGYYPAPRYFKRVAQQGYQQPQQTYQQQPQTYQQQPQPQPLPTQFGGVRPQPEQSLRGSREGDMEIMRQTASKLAVATMPLVPSEQRTFQNQLAIAEAWMRYFIGGLRATGVQLGGNSPLPTQEEQMAMVGGYPADDGIPF